MLTLGQLLRRALERTGLTQIELSRRSGVDKYAIADILKDERDPQLSTLRKLVTAMGMTWAAFFQEPQIAFSSEEARVVGITRDTLDRLLENHASMTVSMPVPPPDAEKSRRRGKRAESGRPLMTKIRDSGAMDEVQPSDAPISEWHYRHGVRRVFTVTTDAMIGPEAGILLGATIFVRPTVDAENADGEIVVCKLNRTHYLKRLDRRGGATTLHSTREGYPKLTVTKDDTFTLIGVVVMQPAD